MTVFPISGTGAANPTPSTVLGAISAAITDRRYNARNELWHYGTQEFAKLNGWKAGYSFSPEKIGKRSREVNFYRDNVFDHCLYFRDGTKAAAIAAQPYNHVSENEARSVGASYNLETHIPPYPLASIYYPNECIFIVFTTLGATVNWLPEQVSGLAVQS